ncbi:MAG: Fic family protein [Alphaproteobacteria bacterium]|nr:Fic family protein [Alphaproteobacteria bacterium]
MLGITDPAMLERHEKAALIAAYDRAATSYSGNEPFTSSDVCNLHRLILGSIFEWAGEYRRADLACKGIKWCRAKFILYEMSNFRRMLERMTPFSPSLSRQEVLSRLAEIHGELIVIHPFLDGNGRTARLLCDLLLMQAEYPPIRLGAFDEQEVQRDYFAAIHDVWEKIDYQPLIALLDRLVAVKPV